MNNQYAEMKRIPVKAAKDAIKNSPLNLSIDEIKLLFRVLDNVPELTGRWEEIDNQDSIFLNFVCTACGRKTDYGRPAFCMRCGARMENPFRLEDMQRVLEDLKNEPRNE